MTVSVIINNLISITQIVLSLVIALATVAYTYYSNLQVQESQRQRKSSVRPVIKGGLEAHGGDAFTFSLINTGNGAAHNLQVKMYFSGLEPESLQFRTPVYAEGEKLEFPLPFEDDTASPKLDRRKIYFDSSDIENIVDHTNTDGSIVIDIEYEDIFGNQYDETDRVELRNYLRYQTGGTTRGEMEKIRRTLDDIESHMKSM